MSDSARPSKRSVVLLGALAMAAGCATSTTERLRLPPLQTDARVELPRYLWIWYEVANFPQRFQRDCTARTVTYPLRADGDLDALNRCRKGSLDGEEKAASGAGAPERSWWLGPSRSARCS